MQQILIYTNKWSKYLQIYLYTEQHIDIIKDYLKLCKEDLIVKIICYK